MSQVHLNVNENRIETEILEKIPHNVGILRTHPHALIKYLVYIILLRKKIKNNSYITVRTNKYMIYIVKKNGKRYTDHKFLKWQYVSK